MLAFRASHQPVCRLSRRDGLMRQAVVLLLGGCSWTWWQNVRKSWMRLIVLSIAFEWMMAGHRAGVEAQLMDTLRGTTPTRPMSWETLGRK